MTGLPVTLNQRLRDLTEGQARGALGEASAALSRRYRENVPSQVGIADAKDALAYALSRMPATYAAVGRVLDELAALLPQFAPASLLDAASGPGTAAWAATERWADLSRVVLMDHNRHFLALSDALAAAAPAALRDAERHEADLRDERRLAEQYDLTILSYALTELDDRRVVEVASRLWAATSGAMVIVEPGRPRDYQRLMTVRNALVSQGAQLLAPCPHREKCPLVEADWCHFSVRLPRNRDHRRLKDASRGFEDEKFSYLVFARDGHEPVGGWARIIKQVRRSKFATTLDLCRRDGAAASLELRKRDGKAYKRAGRLEWGDRLETGENPE